MGLKRENFYTAKEVRQALEALGFTVTKCEPSINNFLVVATNKYKEQSSISCSLEGKKCGAGGLTGQHGLTGLSETQLTMQ